MWSWMMADSDPDSICDQRLTAAPPSRAASPSSTPNASAAPPALVAAPPFPAAPTMMEQEDWDPEQER